MQKKTSADKYVDQWKKMIITPALYAIYVYYNSTDTKTNNGESPAMHKLDFMDTLGQLKE